MGGVKLFKIGGSYISSSNDLKGGGGGRCLG
jgi:hypothetical protein